MYYGRRDQKTAAYRDWETTFLHELGKAGPQQALADLRNVFDINKHCYRMRITWHAPKSDFITKEGKISSRTFDVTNCEKILLDLICLPKYHVQSAHYGAKNLNIDDKYVLGLSSGKRCGIGKWEIRVSIWLEELKKYL